MSDLMKPCMVCGDVSDQTYCEQHRLKVKDSRPKPSIAVGYDQTWRRLSERARRMQPWCSACGTADDLTADHSPEAWQRKQRGLPIRVKDVDVLCRSCNSKKGSARTRGVDPHPSRPSPKADGDLSITYPGGYQ